MQTNLTSIVSASNDYVKRCLEVLQKYNIIHVSSPSQVLDLDKLGNVDKNSFDTLMSYIQGIVPGFDPNNISALEKVLGELLKSPNLPNGSSLERMLDDFTKNQNFSPDDLNSLSSLLEKMDFSKLDLNNLDLSNINLENLDINNLNLNNVSKLVNTKMLSSFANVTVIQKIVMGLASGISATLALTMGVLSKTLIRRKSTGKTKTFVLVTTITLALVAVGLVAGIFVN